MTPKMQQLVLDAAQAIPRDDLPQLRAMAKHVDGKFFNTIVFFSVAEPGAPLYETDDGSLAMGFVGGWIAAMKAIVAAELAAERNR